MSCPMWPARAVPSVEGMTQAHTRPGTSGTAARARFRQAQQRLLDAHGVAAVATVVDVPALRLRADVLVAGEGPPVVLVIGGGVPAVIWAPLMARLPGRTLYAIELPGFGLTGTTRYDHATLRRTAVAHLTGVLDGLDLPACPVVTQSMGSQWTAWLAAEQPDRVPAQVMIGCPAFFLDTSAPLPLRLMSVPGLGRLMQLQRPSPQGAERMLRTIGEDPAGLDEIRDVLCAAQGMRVSTDATTALMRAVMSWTRPRAGITVPADELHGIGHPVRLIWGRGDAFGDVGAGRRIARAIPHADLHVVPGGHAPWFHHADDVGALVQDFLTTHPSPRRAS